MFKYNWSLILLRNAKYGLGVATFLLTKPDSDTYWGYSQGLQRNRTYFFKVFKKFVLMWAIFKVFIEKKIKSLLNLLHYCFCFFFCFFLARGGGLWSTQNLSSLTRHQTCTCCVDRQILTSGQPRKSLDFFKQCVSYIPRSLKSLKLRNTGFPKLKFKRTSWHHLWRIFST